MDCVTYREALSAGLDDESTSFEREAAAAHVRTCPACASWAESAAALTRAARVHVVEDVPDLTAAILQAAALPAHGSARARAAETIDVLPVARIGLALVAIAQVLVGLASLFDAAGHLSREQGVWELALAIGFATAAWQPRRAAGMVPLVAALVAGLFVTASVDAAEGSVAVLSEGHHLLTLVGLALLVTSTRLSPAVPPRLVIG